MITTNLPSSTLFDDVESRKLVTPTTEATSGGTEPLPWVVVAETAGIMPAQIIAGRLKTEGIPVHIRQESASNALPFTFGLLGTAYLLVPEPFAEQARNFLLDNDDEQMEWQESDADPFPPEQ